MANISGCNKTVAPEILFEYVGILTALGKGYIVASRNDYMVCKSYSYLT